MPKLRALLAFGLFGALAAAGLVCGETVEYSSGFLVTVRSEVAVDCIVLSAENPATGAAVSERKDAAEWRSGFREESLKVLVYPVGKLDGPRVVFKASGRRVSCEGQEVARAATGELSFQRSVVPVEVVLQPLFTDADHDGWLVTEDCDDARSEVYPGAPEACDGKDNDCDWSADEGCACSAPRPCFPSNLGPAMKNVGACVEGTQRCTDGAYDSCTDAGSPSAESCNGADDDCDGATDQAVNCPSEQVCRRGRCAVEHEALCDGGEDEDNDGLVDCADLEDCGGVSCGALGTCCAGACVQESACADGLDNDCDGRTDCGDPACGGLPCDAAGRVCASLVCACPYGEGATELCGDGLDQDCDALTDEDWPLGAPCSEGLGICARTGVVVCAGPTAADCSTEAALGDARSEDCKNGLDDDCDGSTDCADSQCATKACLSDGNPCTSDVCGSGLCQHPNLSDGDACTSDNKVCTRDVCAAGTCTHPSSGACCGAGKRCLGDACTDAPKEACAGGVDEDCDGLTDCKDTAASPAGCLNVCSGALGRCVAGGTRQTLAQETACGDGMDNDCDTDIDCADASCANLDCATDTKICTRDVCSGLVCTHPAKAAGTCCGAGNACDASTACVSVASAVDRCDTADNDCDGQTDEYPCGGPTSSDLSESVSVWDVGESSGDTPRICNPVDTALTSVAEDGSKKVGNKSIRADYGPDGAAYFQLFHPKLKDGNWDLSKKTGVAFWIDSETPASYTGWSPPGPTVVLCGSSGSRRLDPVTSKLNAGTRDGWASAIEYQVPFDGNSEWTALTSGSFSLTDVDFIEFHADPNKGSGTGTCKLWLDGVRVY